MGQVLKAKQVRIDEPLRLSIDDASTPVRNGSRQSSGQPRVRVTETNPDFAVIEVTCSCGTVTYVRCDYAPASATTPRGK